MRHPPSLLVCNQPFHPQSVGNPAAAPRKSYNCRGGFIIWKQFKNKKKTRKDSTRPYRPFLQLKISCTVFDRISSFFVLLCSRCLFMTFMLATVAARLSSELWFCTGEGVQPSLPLPQGIRGSDSPPGLGGSRTPLEQKNFLWETLCEMFLSSVFL